MTSHKIFGLRNCFNFENVIGQQHVLPNVMAEDNFDIITNIN